MNQNRLFCPLYILYKTERANKISTLSSGKAVFTTTFDIGITDDVTYQQQILDCLGLQDVNTTDFNYGSWIATAGFNDVRAIATFLNSPSDTNNPYGPTNCGNPAAQEFAMVAMETLENNGEVDFPNFIIFDNDFLNNDCLNGVYDNLGGASTYNSYLTNFDGEFPVAHLKFATSTSLPENTNAVTSPPQNYVITITFNTDNLNRPSLDVARTFIHEMIHAEIFRKLLSELQHPSLQGLTYTALEQMSDDFPGIYDYYIRWKNNIPVGINITNVQHQMMAQHYRDIIEQTLREYDNNSQTDETYKALAWIGLMGEGTFNSGTGLTSNPTIAWANLTQDERLNIINTYQTFKNNNPNCQ